MLVILVKLCKVIEYKVGWERAPVEVTLPSEATHRPAQLDE